MSAKGGRPTKKEAALKSVAEDPKQATLFASFTRGVPLRQQQQQMTVETSTTSERTVAEIRSSTLLPSHGQSHLQSSVGSATDAFIHPTFSDSHVTSNLHDNNAHSKLDSSVISIKPGSVVSCAVIITIVDLIKRQRGAVENENLMRQLEILSSSHNDPQTVETMVPLILLFLRQIACPPNVLTTVDTLLQTIGNNDSNNNQTPRNLLSKTQFIELNDDIDVQVIETPSAAVTLDTLPIAATTTPCVALLQTPFSNGTSVTVATTLELSPPTVITRDNLGSNSNSNSNSNSKKRKRESALADNDEKIAEIVEDSKLHNRRNHYPLKTKLKLGAIFKALLSIKESDGRSRFNMRSATEIIRKRITGYEKVTHVRLKEYMVLYTDPDKLARAKAIKSGRRVNKEFEDEVINSVIFRVLEPAIVTCNGMVTKEQKHKIIANVAYSYETIRTVAKAVMNKRYLHDKDVRKLKFSNKWIKGLLNRYELRKRRCTTTMKNKPSEEETRTRMAAIQKFIIDNNLAAFQVFNEDETGVRWCTPLIHQYVPKDADRAISLTDDSGRFTVMLGSDGNGKMLPVYIILKSSVKNLYDLTSSTILKTLLVGKTVRGVTTPPILPASDGWVLKEFVCEIKDKKNKPHTYKRPYLINTNTLDIVTVQNKAWNDTVGMLLHIREQLGPYKEKVCKDGKMLMVVDNVATHHVAEVGEEFEKAKWTVMFLPPNMTSELQPMDLAVNATCKAAMRRLRIDNALEYMGHYQKRYHDSVRNNIAPPEFRPQNPTYSEGVLTMLGMMQKDFKREDVVAGIARSFQTAGILPKADGGFNQYVSRTHGNIAVKAETQLTKVNIADHLVRIDKRGDVCELEKARPIQKGNDVDENHTTIVEHIEDDVLGVNQCEFHQEEEVLALFESDEIAIILDDCNTEELETDDKMKKQKKEEEDADDDEGSKGPETEGQDDDEEDDEDEDGEEQEEKEETESQDDVEDNEEDTHDDGHDSSSSSSTSSDTKKKNENNEPFDDAKKEEAVVGSTVSCSSQSDINSKDDSTSLSLRMVVAGRGGRSSRGVSLNYCPGDSIPCSCGCGKCYTNHMVKCVVCKMKHVRTLCSASWKCRECSSARL